MFATAIGLSIIFCFYYIVSQARWGFYDELIDENNRESLLSGDEDTTNDTGDRYNYENQIDISGDSKKEDTDEVDDYKPAGEEATDLDTNTNKKSDKVKRAYLTFDDGPSENTGEILDILSKNNVKASFFVVAKEEEYYDYYRRIVKEGHTLALHSYSHDYQKIYSNVREFALDIEELQKLLYDVTGTYCKFYRFPGGSSNSVSQTDMKELISYVEKENLIYLDWNALNNDAVCDSYTPEELVENIMQDADKLDDVIILMHDLTVRHSTVESLQLLIDRLQEAGFELLPIDEDTPLIRHGQEG
jgi:peptidoglycan/xylan/chitin deacetylase (PgdA/CDA1 family)